MRSEEEMMDLILNTAKEDERIRAVILNGSRTNPNARPDIFQDFDVVYLVTDPQPYILNLEWIERFGEMMILQMPDTFDFPGGPYERFTYLMQFADGNRIDLSIDPIDKLDEMERDSLSILLLDKDGIVQPFGAPSEADYLPQRPDEFIFANRCNEFWWVSTYVAKGLWRDEILYAREMLDRYVRGELMCILQWYIGCKTDFRVNPGKLGKHYREYLSADEWEQLMRTYADADYEKTWQAHFEMCDLFGTLARSVAAQLGFSYNTDEESKVLAHLHHVHQLPKDAKSMY